MKKLNLFYIVLIVFLLFCNAFPVFSELYRKTGLSVTHKDADKTAKPTFLIADLTGDGKLEKISLSADYHSFHKASFTIYQLHRDGRNAKRGARLYSLVTSDDYVHQYD